MKHILLFSGGLDSTTVLMKLIDDGITDIMLYYLDIDNNGIKAWCERNAIDSILYELKQESLVVDVKFEKIKVGTYDDFNEPKKTSRQNYIWLSRLPTLIDDSIDTTIHIGYTRGDSLVPHLDDCKAYWESVCSLFGFEKSHKLEYPILNISKVESILHLRDMERKHNIRLVDNLWVCEDPQKHHVDQITGYIKCGKCIPCEKMDKALKTSKEHRR